MKETNNRKERRLEKIFQKKLTDEIEERFEGCIVLPQDPARHQGIPDLLILYEDKWATLECKRTEHSSHRPNQDYYVKRMNKMSFSRFIYPENKESVLDEMERSFKTPRKSRTVQR